MMRIRKGYNLKIISITISVILLSTNALYSFPFSMKTLRLPVGELDDTLERLNKTTGGPNFKAGEKVEFPDLFIQRLQQYEENIHRILKIPEYDNREAGLVFEYDNVIQSLAKYGYLDGMLIYPFMGPDVWLSIFTETIPINRGSKDLKRGETIIKRVYKDSSEEIIASIHSHIQSHEPLEAMEEATYLNLSRPDETRFIFLMKGFKTFSDKYGEEAAGKVLRVVLENVLREGDRILILDNNDLAFMPKIQEAGFSSIGEYRLSLTPSEYAALVVEEDEKGILIPNTVVVLEKYIDKEIFNSKDVEILYKQNEIIEKGM